LEDSEWLVVEKEVIEEKGFYFEGRFLKETPDSKASLDKMFSKHGNNFNSIKEELASPKGKSYRIHSDKIFIPPNKSEESYTKYTYIEIKNMISSAEKEENISRKAGMYCDIGTAFGDIRNGVEQERYYNLAYALLSRVNDIRVKSAILQTQAYLLIRNDSFEDDRKAERLNNEAYELIKNKGHAEIEIVCFFNLARLAARRFDIDEARRKFEKALEVASRHRIEFTDLIEDISAGIAYLNHWETLRHPPKFDLPALSGELIALQSWYPKYKNQILRYWYFSRGIEVCRAIAKQGVTKALIVSDDIDLVEMLEEVLSSLFVTQAYTIRKPTDTKYWYMDVFPMPEKNTFAYSYRLCRTTTDNELIDHYTVQSDGSDKPLPYVFLGDDPREHGFDTSRTPRPAVMCYEGHDLPEAAYKLRPMYYLDNSSLQWFFTPLETEHKSDVVMNTLETCHQIKMIPIFLLEDVASSPASIVASYDVILPYFASMPDEMEIPSELKDARTILELIVKEEKRERHEELLSAFRDTLSVMHPSDHGSLYFQIALLEFPFRMWMDGPYRQQTFPAIILTSIYSECFDVQAIQRNVILRKIGLLYGETNLIALCDIDDIWNCYEEINTLRQKWLHIDEKVAIYQANIVDSMMDKYVTKIKKENLSAEKIVPQIEKAISKLTALRNEGFESTSKIAEVLAEVWFMLGGASGMENKERVLDAITEIRNSGHKENEHISYYVTVGLSDKYLNDTTTNRKEAYKTLFAILYDNPSSKRIAIKIAKFIDHSFTDNNLSAEDAIALLEELRRSGFEGIIELSFLIEIKRLCLHQTGEDFSPKLKRIRTLINQLRSKKSFDSYLCTSLCEHLKKIYFSLNESDLNILVSFVENLMRDDNYANENLAIHAVVMLVALTDMQAHIKDIKALIARIKNIRNHFMQSYPITVFLMAAHHPIIRKQKQKQRAVTISTLRALYKKLDDVAGLGAVELAQALRAHVSHEKMEAGDVIPVIDELESIVQNSLSELYYVPKNLVDAYCYAATLHEAIPVGRAYERIMHLQETFAIEGVGFQILFVRTLMACQKADIEVLTECQKTVLEKPIASEDEVRSFVSIWATAMSLNINNSAFILSIYELMDGIIASGFEKNETVLAAALVGYSNTARLSLGEARGRCLRRFVELFVYGESPFLLLVMDFLFILSNEFYPDYLGELCDLLQGIIPFIPFTNMSAVCTVLVHASGIGKEDRDKVIIHNVLTSSELDHEAMKNGNYRSLILLLMQARKEILSANDEC
jgi:tetratricopeptide (TPR) repeat protein